MSPVKLVWYQRKDGLWNAECACNATICGVMLEHRGEAESWHFKQAAEERAFRASLAERFSKNQIPPCGSKLPDPDPNLPGGYVFP